MAEKSQMTMLLNKSTENVIEKQPRCMGGE
jgi:hypothetical protein